MASVMLNERSLGSSYKRLRRKCKVKNLLTPHCTAPTRSPSEQESDDPRERRRDKIRYLSDLRSRIGLCKTVSERVATLSSEPTVVEALHEMEPRMADLISQLSSYDKYCVLAMLAIGQRHVLHPGGAFQDEGQVEKRLQELVNRLLMMEQFYDTVGGIIGYQLTALTLMEESSAGEEDELSSNPPEAVRKGELAFHVPKGPDLENDTEFAKEMTLWGIESLPRLSEIYPLGGAGDRLGLVSNETGESLPVALLPYNGKTLLHTLLMDLEAREWLYFKLYGERIVTPVAIMTSEVKSNHYHIRSLCESMEWFYRGDDNFHLFQQPLVPVCCLHNEGEWLLDSPLRPSVKPGGHGALWKLMYDKGVLEWLQQNQGRSGSIVRQISNPIAGTDNTLLSLSGIGVHLEKAFGFASCERTFGASEGANVLVEWHHEGCWKYAVSNVEYTEFKRYHIQDEATSCGNGLSRFPANTNVLYADLKAIENAIASNNANATLPGMLVNLDQKDKEYAQDGVLTRAGRLECSMQNIADVLSTTSEKRVESIDWNKLDTFLVYNRRRKVTSSAKKKRLLGSTKLSQTPDGSFLDYIRNAREALELGGWSVPSVNDSEQYAQSGPGIIVSLHPALGPLWEVMAQKLRNGVLDTGSELRLDVAEADVEGLSVKGSFCVEASNPLGPIERRDANEGRMLRFSSEECGKLRLRNVRIANEGVEWQNPNNVFWKNRIARNESLMVRLEGNAEFEAHDVDLLGGREIAVPSGYRLLIRPGVGGEPEEHLEGIHGRCTWHWEYSLSGSDIVLSRLGTSSQSS